MFQNLPWWAKVPFIGGGSLMTGFSSAFPDWLQTAGATIGVGLVLFGIIAMLWHRVRLWQVQQLRFQFFPDRASLHRAHGTLAKRFAGVSSVSALWVVGQKFYHGDESIGVLRELLLPNPDGNAIKYLAKTVARPDISRDIRSTTQMALKSGTNVRWYDHFIFSSIILADIDKPSGWMHIETVLPYSKPERRPSYTVKKSESEEAVLEMARIFRRIWDEAKEASEARVEPIASNQPQERLMSCLRLFSIAEAEYGWDFTSEHSLHQLDILFGIREACSFREIQAWGRQNRNIFEQLNRGEVLVPIDAEHWHDYELEIWDALRTKANFDVITVCKREREWKRGGFRDVQFDQAATVQWLSGPANKYKGHTQR
jgi:hypothetical protein